MFRLCASASSWRPGRSTAAPDARAEHGILTTLRRMTAGKMALVVSHRLAPARQADLIVVMNGVASSRPEPTKS